MKKQGKWIVAVVAALAVVLSGAAFAAGNAGSAGDPLVTLSYLEKVFSPKVDEAVDQAVKANMEELKTQLNGAIDQWSEMIGKQTVGAGSGGTGGSVFSVVTLSNGQTLTGEVGCEVMLRVGSATCVSASSPGLIDTTSGGTLNNGSALATNHLYMVTIETRGVRATSGTVKVLVRGSYTVN